MDLLRIAAFSDGNSGGNPAGVVIADKHPAEAEMRRVATEVGYSETAFATREGEGWRVRYFSPESEVPFCGHATIALGAALARQEGNGVFQLTLNDAKITVEGECRGDQLSAALQSPPTQSAGIAEPLVSEVLEIFGYTTDDLNMAIPPARIHGGADHLVFTLKSRAALAAMDYLLDSGRKLMLREALVTIMFVFSESSRQFHSRNPFASGGVFEDPATGAASAAFGGYLRDLAWPHQGSINIVQGGDMGERSIIQVDISAEAGASIRVSGSARIIGE